MPRSVTFTLDVEPAGKGRPRGRVAVSKKTGRQFVQEYTPARTAHAEQLIRAQVKTEACGEFFEAGVPLRLDVEFVMARPPSAPKKRLCPVTKPDLDNCEKLLCDALERFLYANDAQIVECHKRKAYGPAPCIRMRLSEVEASGVSPDMSWLDARQEVLL